MSRDKFVLRGHSAIYWASRTGPGEYTCSDEFSRVMGDLDDPAAVDFDGGPFLTKGSNAGFGEIVKFVLPNKIYINDEGK